ncbi:MAG: hypothetical protein AAB919_01240 [Patescibacteria group bacterium]
MNRYLEHLHRKPTHERRQHAMRVAGVLTALVFVGWVTTLGMQLGTTNNSAQVAGTDNTGQTAAALQSGYDAAQGGNQLIVSTTTDY